MSSDIWDILGPVLGLVIAAGALWIVFRSVRAFVGGIREGYTRGPNKLQKSQPPASVPPQQSSRRTPVGAPSGPRPEAGRQPPVARELSNRIFISYRRDDSPDVTGRIYDRLISEFGKPYVFKDVDALPLGEDFRAHLEEAVAKASVVLAVIGPRWAGSDQKSGATRLHDSRDFVSIELSAALERRIPVVPVLVSGAQMPAQSHLPKKLANLVYRQAIGVRPDPDFHNDVDRLIKGIRHLLSRVNE